MRIATTIYTTIYLYMGCYTNTASLTFFYYLEKKAALCANTLYDFIQKVHIFRLAIGYLARLRLLYVTALSKLIVDDLTGLHCVVLVRQTIIIRLIST